MRLRNARTAFEHKRFYGALRKPRSAAKASPRVSAFQFSDEESWQLWPGCWRAASTASSWRRSSLARSVRICFARPARTASRALSPSSSSGRTAAAAAHIGSKRKTATIPRSVGSRINSRPCRQPSALPLNPVAAFSRRCFLGEARSGPHAHNCPCRPRYPQKRRATRCSDNCRCTPNGPHLMRSWRSVLDTA
jgi:hypothetical protein